MLPASVVVTLILRRFEQRQQIVDRRRRLGAQCLGDAHERVQRDTLPLAAL